MLQATLPDRLVALRCPEAAHYDGPAWTPDEHDVDRWCRLVRSAGGPCGREDLRLPSRGPRESYVVIHPGAAAGSRRWPAGRWAAVTAALAIGGIDVVVTGSAAERDPCARVADAGGRSLAGRLDLDGLADVVARARLVLCGDTGVGHLATAFGTPSVRLFGPIPPSWWGPAIDPDLHAVIWHGDASPTTGDPHADTVDPALAHIEVEEVLEAAHDLLADASTGRQKASRFGSVKCGYKLRCREAAGSYRLEERVVGADVVDLIMSDHREVERLFEILKTRPDQRVTTLPVLSALLIAHSRAEESEVYPVARDEAGAADDVAHSQEEHVEAEQLLERLQATDPEAAEFDAALQQVVDAVTHHVEEEESKVLPAMRTGLQDTRREELGQAFAASRAEHLGEMPGEATKEALLQQAQNVGMGGGASMSKDELQEELQKEAGQ